MPGVHKNPTISFRISDYERREIEVKIKASGMMKKDYFIRSCIYNHVCVVGKKETVHVLVKELEKMQQNLYQLHEQLLSEEIHIVSEEIQELQLDYEYMLKAIFGCWRAHDICVKKKIQSGRRVTIMEEAKVELKMINMADVQASSIEWLWYPFIPYGKLTIIQGDPGDGKSTLVLNIAARLSEGEGLDDEMKPYEPINVIYRTAEDGLADTVKPRLELAGADCSRISIIDESENLY
jgi:hypothetical protein